MSKVRVTIGLWSVVCLLMLGVATTQGSVLLQGGFEGSSDIDSRQQAAYMLAEDFSNPAWKGAGIWDDWAWEMVDGTNGWQVISAQSGSLGRAYVRDDRTDWSAAISAATGQASPSSITHDVPLLVNGSVSFSWADGYGYSHISVQLLGPGDVLASEMHFGNQENAYFRVDSNVFLPDDGTSGMYSTYSTPANITINFDCAGAGTITADLNNGVPAGTNFADGMSAPFGTSVPYIERIRLMAHDDPSAGNGSEMNIGGFGALTLYNGVTITGTEIPEPATIGLVALGALGLIRRRRA